MKILPFVSVCILAVCLAQAAVDPATGRIIPGGTPSKPVKPDKPIIKPDKPIINPDKPILPPPATNSIRRMRKQPVRVVSQAIQNNKFVVSQMSDGSVFIAPLRRATTARIPHAINAFRVEEALKRIVTSSGSDSNLAARAHSLEIIAEQIERSKPPRLSKE